jgi:hypothetical protein
MFAFDLFSSAALSKLFLQPQLVANSPCANVHNSLNLHVHVALVSDRRPRAEAVLKLRCFANIGDDAFFLVFPSIPTEYEAVRPPDIVPSELFNVWLAIGFGIGPLVLPDTFNVGIARGDFFGAFPLEGGQWAPSDHEAEPRNSSDFPYLLYLHLLILKSVWLIRI